MNFNPKGFYMAYIIILTSLVMRDIVDWKHIQFTLVNLLKDTSEDGLVLGRNM